MAINIENQFKVENISLGVPNQLQNNLYFSRLTMNDEPLIIQSGECYTTTGLKTANNKTFCDLVYKSNENLCKFFDSLEIAIKEKLLENNNEWFEEPLNCDDIDEAFTSSLVYTKNGIRLRTYIQKDNINGKNMLNCYDFRHELMDTNEFKIGKNIIPIFEIIGLKFTDKIFNLEIKLIQVLMSDVDSVSKTKFLFDKSIKDNTLESKTHDIESNYIEENESDLDDNSDVDIYEDNLEESKLFNDKIEEIELDKEYLDNNVMMKLKTHADIYEEIWKMQKDEAYKIRKQNIQIYLNSKNIFSNALINEIC